MSEIKRVKLSSIDNNPFRSMTKYPFNDHKIETLRQSFRDVGMWEGLIVRPKKGGYELPFGHHRIHAARKEFGKDATISVIVRDLTDKQMVQFMGRENLEDYNTDFPVMLESWEAGLKFGRRDAQNTQDLDIAILLGWTRPAASGNTLRMNETAQACSNTSKLIAGGHLDLDDVRELSVKSVRELTGRIVAKHESLERMAKVTGRSKRETESAKRTVSRSGRYVAEKVRSGSVAPRDIRGEVDVHAHRIATKDKRESPLFATFAKPLIDQIAKVCNHDSIHAKFVEIEKSLDVLTMDEDVNSVKLIAMQCGFAEERFGKWKKTFTDPKRKVVKLTAIEDQRG